MPVYNLVLDRIGVVYGVENGLVELIIFFPDQELLCKRELEDILAV